jgi:hypothetical protein
MNTVKELLHSTIETLTDQEAEAALRLVRGLRARDIDAVLHRLAQNPTFEVPPPGERKLRDVQPARGRGRPASELLIEDRR